MRFPLLEKPLFEVGGHYVTFLGLIAFAALFAVGIIIARFLQSDLVRRLFSRFKIDTNFIAIVTTILSLSALVFFTVSAVNAAGIPLYWNAPLPGVTLSLLQIFLLIALLIAVAGITGQVRQIRARSTLIMTNDNIAMIVPNEKFIDSPVTNWSYTDRRVRFRLPVGVAYGSDVNKVREALIAAAREHPATLKDPAPDAFLEKFGDSTIDFQLVVWSEEMSRRPSRFKSDLNYLICKHLGAAGIEIPNPQRDLHIRSGTLKVESVTKQETRERSEG